MSEDLHAYLIAECWELHRRWNRDATPSFKQYASYVLRLRVVDHCRKERGRSKWVFGNGYSHERERPRVLSLDAPAEPGGDPLGEFVAARTGDPEDDCDSAFGGLLEDGDRKLAGDLDALRLEAPRCVAIRARPMNGGARKTAE